MFHVINAILLYIYVSNYSIECIIDNSMTLLHFIVQTYISECKEPMKETLPVPEPSDVDRAAHVTFDDLQQGLKELKIKLAGE